MPRQESILLHSTSGDGYNDLTPLSTKRRGPGAMTGENSAKARLREKLRKIEALFAGAGTAGRVAKKLKLQERRAVIPSRRSLAACRPLGFLGRSRAPSRIGGHTRGTYGVGTYPGLLHWDGGP
jgi:hypothetical protein